MKWYFRIILFFLVLFVMVQLLSIIFIPNPSNLKQFNFYEKGKFELLDEKNDTVDTLFIGDSLIYSSIIPMHIWNEYGFTSFDCSLPSQTLGDSIDYLKVGIESQHPKVVFLESDVVFRRLRSRVKTKNDINFQKNWVPLLKFHNNWKQITDDEYINVYKGYKINIKAIPVTKFKSKNVTKKYKSIKEENLKIFNEMLDICDKNNIIFILIDIPNHKTWNYVRHNTIENLAKEKNIEFLDLNLEEVGIDWNTDTKDGGEHMNFSGAKKISSFVGAYLKSLKLVEDHREDEKYKEWHKTYELFVKKSVNYVGD